MNLHVIPPLSGTPLTDEPRRRLFTSTELQAMEAAGILHPDERVELIDGEVITMAAKTPRHNDLCAALIELVADHRPGDVRFTMEPAMRLSEHFEPEPDIVLFPRGLQISQVHGPAALLVIEVAVTSLSYDLDVKAPRYAAHGVRECWVVDGRRLVTHVHRDPSPDGYRSIVPVPADGEASALLVPTLRLRLASFGFEPLLDE